MSLRKISFPGLTLQDGWTGSIFIRIDWRVAQFIISAGLKINRQTFYQRRVFIRFLVFGICRFLRKEKSFPFRNSILLISSSLWQINRSSWVFFCLIFLSVFWFSYDVVSLFFCFSFADYPSIFLYAFDYHAVEVQPKFLLGLSCYWLTAQVLVVFQARS